MPSSLAIFLPFVCHLRTASYNLVRSFCSRPTYLGRFQANLCTDRSSQKMAHRRDLTSSTSSFGDFMIPSEEDLSRVIRELELSPSLQARLSEVDGGVGPTHGERVFVNRSLDLNNIRFFGFDMDYTLAIYKSPVYEEYSFQLLARRLVDIGYPTEMLSSKYDPTFPLRGLFFDKEFGNLLKLDMYGNILLCVHGFEEIDQHVVRKLYPSKFVTIGEERFFALNTLFNLPEAYMLAWIVNYFDKNPAYRKVNGGTGIESDELILSYSSIHQDVRHAVDWVHAKGELKQETIKNCDKFIEKDRRLPLLLHKMRQAGRKVFVVTNSGWQYTKSVMTYLFDFPHGPEPDMPHRPWTDYFDAVIVDAKKPLFFESGTVLRLVNPETGALSIGKFKGAAAEGTTHVWAGGSSSVFCQLLGAQGKEILFIGDHIFGDILRSKKQQGWRTFLVVPELDQEVRDWTAAQALFTRLRTMEYIMSTMYQSVTLGLGDEEMRILRQKIKETAMAMDVCHKSRLGSLFRSGSRQTYFAMQAMRYADLYASTFINLMNYPFHYLFRAPHQLMPHEQLYVGEKVDTTASMQSSLVIVPNEQKLHMQYTHDEDDESDSTNTPTTE